MKITRRSFLTRSFATLAATAGTAALGGYALAIEPAWRLRIQEYKFTPAQWPRSLRLRAAIITDLHACEPWVGVRRIRQIVQATLKLEADVIFLLGDYVSGQPFQIGTMAPEIWAAELGKLRAPLGVHAVLGNHDWWTDKTAQKVSNAKPVARRALEAVGIPVYENDVKRLTKDGQSFWVAGLGDQWAWSRQQGVDDLVGTLAKVTDGDPIILLAHEPDIFPTVPDRVALTLSGHTHGGQVRVMGWSPIVPSDYGGRYAYGHIIERDEKIATAKDRHLIVSAGLGCTGLPLRFGVPPEIVHIELGGMLTA
jgi:uncharacterized protein